MWWDDGPCCKLEEPCIGWAGVEWVPSPSDEQGGNASCRQSTSKHCKLQSGCGHAGFGQPCVQADASCRQVINLQLQRRRSSTLPATSKKRCLCSLSLHLPSLAMSVSLSWSPAPPRCRRSLLSQLTSPSARAALRATQLLLQGNGAADGAWRPFHVAVLPVPASGSASRAGRASGEGESPAGGDPTSQRERRRRDKESGG